MKKNKVCIIIPCYKVSDKIENVINKINFNIVDKVFIIDDNCPEETGKKLKEKISNLKVEIIIHEKNLGVGGATITGFKKALNENFDIIFKLDGDGQHDPKHLNNFLEKFENPNVNFCKGSRFLDVSQKKRIPFIRYVGNIALTFLTKKNCKLPEITDAVNGFLAIRSDLLKKINLDEISFDYFFEEDLLFKLSFFDIKINEIAIDTIYFKKGNTLNPFLVLLPFLFRHIRNFLYRLKYELLTKK